MGGYAGRGSIRRPAAAAGCSPPAARVLLHAANLALAAPPPPHVVVAEHQGVLQRAQLLRWRETQAQLVASRAQAGRGAQHRPLLACCCPAPCMARPRHRTLASPISSRRDSDASTRCRSSAVMLSPLSAARRSEGRHGNGRPDALRVPAHAARNRRQSSRVVGQPCRRLSRAAGSWRRHAPVPSILVSTSSTSPAASLAWASAINPATTAGGSDAPPGGGGAERWGSWRRPGRQAPNGRACGPAQDRRPGRLGASNE